MAAVVSSFQTARDFQIFPCDKIGKINILHFSSSSAEYPMSSSPVLLSDLSTSARTLFNPFSRKPKSVANKMLEAFLGEVSKDVMVNCTVKVQSTTVGRTVRSNVTWNTQIPSGTTSTS